jgi:hypothetical protein
LVGHLVRGVIAEIKARGFFAIERAGAAAAEDSNLMAAFVHGAVAIFTVRYGESRPSELCSYTEFRSTVKRCYGF